MRATHRVVFIRANGDGPYVCAYCGLEMISLEVVHHHDEDRSNNELSNLQSMHHDCHSRYHQQRRKMSEVTRQRMSDSNRLAYAEGRHDVSGERHPFFGRKHSDETKQKMSESLIGNNRTLGMVHSPETRRKMGESQRAAWARRQSLS